jgi:hypothetical protein
MQRHETVIGKMLMGKRRILASDLQIIARYVGIPPPSILTSAGTFGETGHVQPRAYVREAGVIGAHWVENPSETLAGSGAGHASIVADDRFPVDEQAAYMAPDITHLSLGVHGRTYVVTVPWRDYRVKPLNGDLAVLRQERAELVSFSLARWHDGSWQSIRGGTGGQPAGLVIAIQTRIA